MWVRTQPSHGGYQRFFYLSIRYANLRTYYNNMFTLVHQYKYTLTELENMMPWERDMYVGMVNNWVKDEENRIKQQKDKATQDLRNLMKAKNKTQRR